MSNKKILIVSECFYPEEFKINDLALAWIDRGYDVDVLTLVPTYPLGKVFKGYKNKLFHRDTYLGINIIRVHAVTGYRNNIIKKIIKYINFMIAGSIVAVFIGRKYNYIFGFNLGSLTDMMPAIVIRKLYKTPTTLWVQDIWPDSVYAYGFKRTKILSGALDAYVKFIYSNITSMAISGKGFKAKLKPYINKGTKIYYAPNWPDNLNMDIGPAILSKEIKVHITFAGNVGKFQNLDNIISAFCLLPDNYQKISQLNIIGDGSNLDKLKLIANNNRSIIFHGNQKRKDMSKFYKASDFLIVSLIDESVFSATVPAKTQTYIAAKKPILAIINGDTADIITDNNIGFYADPSDIKMISKLFQECIDMPDSQKEEFSINCQKLLKTTFNKEIIINRLTENLTN